MYHELNILEKHSPNAKYRTGLNTEKEYSLFQKTYSLISLLSPRIESARHEATQGKYSPKFLKNGVKSQNSRNISTPSINIKYININLLRERMRKEREKNKREMLERELEREPKES